MLVFLKLSFSKVYDVFTYFQQKFGNLSLYTLNLEGSRYGMTIISLKGMLGHLVLSMFELQRV